MITRSASRKLMEPEMSANVGATSHGITRADTGTSSQPDPKEHELHTHDNHAEVERWLNRSHHEQEEHKARTVSLDGKRLDDRDPSPPSHVQHTTDCNGTDGILLMLASALKDLAAATASNKTLIEGTNAKMLSRLCTPKDLPSFGGDPMEWLHFKQAYEESTKLCNFSNQENLWRLRKCLHGTARNAVTALLIGATSPADVMSALELQFGNPDVIISKIMHDINRLQPMSQEYHKDIVAFSVKIKNYVAAVLAIGHEEYLRGTNVVSVILSKLPTILISKWADYSYPLLNNGNEPKLVILADFLNKEAVKISKTSVNLAVNQNDYKRKQYDYSNKHKQNDYSTNRVHTVLEQGEFNCEEICRFCNLHKHKLVDCKKFKKALRKDRWQFVKRNGLCYKCIVSHHNRESCSAPVCDKENCGQSHHRLLHYENTHIHNGQSQQQTSEVTTNDSLLRNETVTHINVNCSKVLLKTVPIKIHGPNGTEKTVALLDDGSSVSIISDTLMGRLGMRGRKQTLKVRGAWDESELVCDSEILDLNVSNMDGAMFKLQARSAKRLNLPTQYISLDKLMCNDFIRNIKHQLCDGQCKPEILIGQDNYHLLLPLEINQGNPSEPYVTRTPLGWCIHGRTTLDVSFRHAALFISENTDEVQMEEKRMLYDLHEEVRQSFTIEAMGISAKPRQNAEDVRAIEHLERTSYMKDGRWYVSLPWKDVNRETPESYSAAYSRLKGVEKKLKTNQGYAERYSERIDHLLQNDYAEEVIDIQTTPNTWYLPHFGVDNPNKKKLRLVFDAAAKSNGYSLNDFLITGPDLLVSLYGIMLRFREFKVAVAGDIRDMFLRVKIQREDQHALRFLWRASPNEPLKTYAMTSLIFGANCSPFVAQFIKNKNAKQYETTNPAAVYAIIKQHFMDDYVDSIQEESAAVQLVKDVAYIHKQGGFEIRNWASSSEAILDSLPKESLCPSAVRFKVNQQDAGEAGEAGERVLGIIWFVKEDTLGFDLSLKRIPESITNGQKRPTKREILRIVMSIFDVYGFLSPFTIQAKIILQQVWRKNLSWDDEIPSNLNEMWLKWLTLLKSIHQVRLPRCYHNCNRRNETVKDSDEVYINLELHLFCDSSTQAMCTVAYWRWENKDGQIQTAFISSKCRVAPVKNTSVPRLELQAALLAARLADTIVKEHRMVPQQRYFWCDSSTVLHWIRNNARDYKMFVAHRLGEIDELTQMKEWRYVPTKMNTADIGTRDTCELDTLENEWFYGPKFLLNEKDLWPADIQPKVSTSVLERVNIIITENDLPAIPEPERFSSWLRLLKTTCVVLSFIDKCRKLKGDINGDMMRRAERLLILYSQKQTFADDLEHLKNNKPLERKSKLLTLTPVIDEFGVLRVGGRIDSAAEISPETKRPVILDGRNYITTLLVRHHHVKAAHGNQETVVNNLKQNYWIIRLRPTVKQITSKCMFCRIKKAQPQPPRMGDLPEARMAHHQRPFTFCGVDLFGPMEVTVGRRREKRYGVLFTCMTVRAIHIEIVTKLTSDALIMALRRMAARRGWPLHLFSDNGTNMRGAHTELKKSIKDLDEETLKREASNKGATWTFSPPASPHWGGAWERLIRCVKNALKVILKEQAPHDETLSTLLAEVEHMVNSRPLTHVSVEPHSDESLTPNHFLLGSSSNLPTIGVFGQDVCLRKQWRIAQVLADNFWKRWVREVLPDMRPRTKWTKEERPLQEGDLVLIVDPDSPRNVWPRGIVQRTMAGADGRIRVVEIKTKSGLLRRAVARVARVPTDG